MRDLQKKIYKGITVSPELNAARKIRALRAVCSANGAVRVRLTRAQSSHHCVRNLTWHFFASPPLRAPQRSLQTTEHHHPHIPTLTPSQEQAQTLSVDHSKTSRICPPHTQTSWVPSPFMRLSSRFMIPLAALYEFFLAYSSRTLLSPTFAQLISQLALRVTAQQQLDWFYLCSTSLMRS